MKNWVILSFVVSMGSFAQGQVVQLPSVGSFGTSGTVVVPDQGSVGLGGTSRSAAGRTTSGWGPTGSRAAGQSASATSASLNAVIIDLQAMDEAILDQAAQAAQGKRPDNFAARSHGKPVVNTLTPHTYSRHTVNPRTGPPSPNDWAIALGGPGQPTPPSPPVNRKESVDARYYMHKAAEATALGRIAAAKVYYRLAEQHLAPEQLQRLEEIQARNAEAAKRGGRVAKNDTQPATSTAQQPAAAPADAATDAGSSDTASPFDPPGDAPMDASPF